MVTTINIEQNHSAALILDITRGLIQSYTFAKKALGYVGAFIAILILMFVIAFFALPILYGCMFIGYRQLKKRYQDMLDIIPFTKERDLIEAEFKISKDIQFLIEFNNTSKELTRIISLFSPISNLSEKVLIQAKVFHETLFKAAYPDFHEEPSEAQLDRLAHAFKDIDW